MAVPGFVGESASLDSLSSYGLSSYARGRTPLGADQMVVPQLNWNCVTACQDAWSSCLSGCQWWEWVVGSCPPKCRGQWAACVGHC
jgi:hypothetical protein